MKQPMPGYRLRHDITLALAVAAINAALLFIISRSSAFNGTIGQAVGWLMVVNVTVAIVSLFKRQWITSIALGLAAAFCWIMLGYG
jgi:hypothetical protein